MNKYIDIYRFLIVLLLIAYLAGCKASLLSPVGETVAEDQRYPLAGSDRIEFITNDLTATFELDISDENVHLRGTVALADRLTYNFHTLEHFSFRVYFLGAEGKVLGVKRIISAPYRKAMQVFHCDIHPALPKGTIAMAFGYDGRAMDTGGGGPPDEDDGPGGVDRFDFWHLPTG
jgi:hypothetical protein